MANDENLIKLWLDINLDNIENIKWLTELDIQNIDELHRIFKTDIQTNNIKNIKWLTEQDMQNIYKLVEALRKNYF